MVDATKKASELLADSAIPFDTACMLVKELEEKLDMHKKIMAELCVRNGGEVFVRPCETQGTLMARIEPPGIRFRFVPDADPN